MPRHVPDLEPTGHRTDAAGATNALRFRVEESLRYRPPAPGRRRSAAAAAPRPGNKLKIKREGKGGGAPRASAPLQQRCTVEPALRPLSS